MEAFLESKTARPVARRDLVVRRRLLDFLHRHIDSKLVVVQGGPGLGKTTLLCQLAEEVEFPVCWYHLDQMDRDVPALVRGMVASLAMAYPEFGGRVLSAITAGTGQPDVMELAGLFDADAKTNLTDYTVLVLDDVHEVLEVPGASLFLETLVQYLPESLHLVMASRKRLPFRGLPRLLANQQAAMLPPSELSFNLEEVRLYYLLNQGKLISDEDLKAVCERSHGWPVALVLGSLDALLSAPTANTLTGSVLLEYLAAEVLDQISPAVKDFLVKTGFLGDLKPDLCNYLLERADSQSILDELSETNPLVSRTTDGAFTVHAVLREAVLGMQQPSSMRGLSLRAAEWYSRAGRWQEAFELLRSAGLEEAAVQTVEEQTDSLIARGLWTAIKDTVGRLSVDLWRLIPGFFWPLLVLTENSVSRTNI